MRKIAILMAAIAVAGALAASDAGASTNNRALRAKIARDALSGRTTSSTSGGTTSAAGGSVTASADFNNDGRKDLAVGVPGEDGVGAVQIFFGGANGLRTDNDQIIRVTDLCSGFWGNAGNFGTALAAGNFDGDNRVELAVGAPGTDTWGISDAGAVMIIDNTPGGFDPAGSCQFVYEENTGGSVPGMKGTEAENGDRIGWSLAAGNFGNGPQDDLALGTPREDFNEGSPDPLTTAGAAYVIFGTPTGLMDNVGNSIPVGSSSFLTQDLQLLNGISEFNDNFGYALAAGNLGRTSHSELVIGAPGESVNDQTQAGVVHVLYGSNDGNLVTNDLYLTQDSDGMKEEADEFDILGLSLAIGNFGKSSHNDLAIGVPEEDVGNNGVIAGAAAVVYGSSGGITTKGNHLFTQNTAGVPDKAESTDFFGFTLAAGNFGRSSHHDLAIGSLLESIGPNDAAGSVHVLYGRRSGLSGSGAQFWSQNSQGIADNAEANDGFGQVLTAGNYGRSNHADLAIGVPSEDLPVGAEVGAVHVLSGSSTGLRTTGARFLTQGNNNVEDTGEANDRFGGGLS